jgi:2-keto-3-deoxy-L-rhamnonate aldolase RhmA
MRSCGAVLAVAAFNKITRFENQRNPEVELVLAQIEARPCLTAGLLDLAKAFGKVLTVMAGPRDCVSSHLGSSPPTVKL